MVWSLIFTALISREEAMQVFANLLVGKGSALPDEAETDELLSSISDQETITPEYHAAVGSVHAKGTGQGLCGRYAAAGGELLYLLVICQAADDALNKR